LAEGLCMLWPHGRRVSCAELAGRPPRLRISTARASRGILSPSRPIIPQSATYRGDLFPTWFLGVFTSPHSKRHLDRFSRFCRTHSRGQHTHRQTVHVMCVTIGRMLCGLYWNTLNLLTPLSNAIKYVSF